MGFKVYGNLEKRMDLYTQRMRLADEEYEKWEPGARDRYRRYRGTLRPKQVNAQGHVISTPTGTATIDALFASLTAVEVDINITPVGNGTQDEAYLAQTALKQEWRTTRVQRKCEPSIKDALVTDIGWVKVYYEYAEHDEVKGMPEEEIAAAAQAPYEQAMEDGTELPDPTEVASGIPLLDSYTVIDLDRICVDYVPYNALRWDPVAKRVEDIRWIAQITKMTRHEVEDNDQWMQYLSLHRTKNKFIKSKPENYVSEVEINAGDTTDERNQDPEEFFTVIEMWDLEAATFCVYIKGGDYLLYEAPNPFSIFLDKIDRSPFVPFILREDPEHVRGISDMRLMMPILEELDLYRSNLATYTDRMTPKMLGKKGALSTAGKKAYSSREYGAFVEMEDGIEVTDIRDLPVPVLPAEIFNIPDKLENEVREATGVSELMRGMFPEGTRRSATETQQVVAGSAGRQAEKRNRLAEAYKSIAKRMLRLMQMFYDQERITRIVDEYGEIEWHYTNEDILLDAHLEISLTPLEEKTAQTRRDDVLGVLNVLGPLPMVDQGALIRWALEEMGLARTLVMTLVKTPEQQQVEQQGQLQSQAEQMAVAQGGMPNPTNVPGPYSGADLAAAANPGEIPPGIAAGGAGAAPGSEEMVAELLQ